MSPRVYKRSFDWDEAKRLHDQGISYAKLAARYGVSVTAIMFACRPDAYEKSKRAAYQWNNGGTCVDCGASCARTADRCEECHHAWLIVSSPIARKDSLQCESCREWKPDDSFPFANSARKTRRGRHALCRSCQTIKRRDYRNRNKVPCANGCGTLVLALNEQQSSARARGVDATGMCHRCACKTKKQRAA